MQIAGAKLRSAIFEGTVEARRSGRLRTAKAVFSSRITWSVSRRHRACRSVQSCKTLQIQGQKVGPGSSECSHTRIQWGLGWRSWMGVWSRARDMMARTGTVRSIAKRAAARVAPDAIVFHGPRTGPRRVALTFDDGPDALTFEYLDLLDEHQARATFFVVGASVERHQEALRETIRRGHEVAGHGFSHKPFSELSAPAIASELLLTQDMLPPPMLRRPVVRPPYGTVTVRSVLSTAAAGFTSVIWSLDSDDCRTEDSKVVVDRLSPERVETGDIVLLHEGQRWTLEALPLVVSRLKSAGYELVTVSELLDPRLP